MLCCLRVNIKNYSLLYILRLKQQILKKFNLYRRKISRFIYFYSIYLKNIDQLNELWVVIFF